MKKRSFVMMVEGTNRIKQYPIQSVKVLAVLPVGVWVKTKDLTQAIKDPSVTPQRLGKQLKDMLETGKVKRKVEGNVVFWKKV